MSEGEEPSSTFYEANIMQIPKYDKDATKKKKNNLSNKN